MLTLLPGYQIDSLIQESADSFIYRGYREIDAQPIILKVLKPDYCTPIELARYQREFSIIRHLKIEGVIQAYKLEKYQNTLVLILENFSGKPLINWTKKNRFFSLSQFLKIAIQIAEVLGQIHERNIIHQNLNPANILFDSNSGKIKIIDFGMAIEMSGDRIPMQTNRNFDETLAYISPEQTGRMNRVLDYRTDFYSLGITFYELVVGHLPFHSVDPMELIHSHIALTPKSPHQIDSRIPKAISDIIMKMLEKTAEDRYQSAWGIEADLVLCLMQLEATGLIEDLVPGENDIRRNFQVSQKFYGREKERDRILVAWERVLLKPRTLINATLSEIEGKKPNSACQDIPSEVQVPNLELILIEGEAGIGKSALVAEIKKVISQQSAYLISGKFSPNLTERPGEAIRIGLQDFLKHLLTESEEQLNRWKSIFLGSLCERLPMVIDLIPELQLIVGEEESVEKTSYPNLDTFFIISLLEQLAFSILSCQHPIVLFLDNLQWIDAESLNLLKNLLDGTRQQNVLVIATYRANELQNFYPEKILKDRIESQGGNSESIVLDALDLEETAQLIADTLQTDITSVLRFANIALQKTQGNPFYIHKLLNKAYLKKFLDFDNQSLSWQWDIEKIESMKMADNVVMATSLKFDSLPVETQEILEFASCVGLDFDLNLISKLCQRSESEISRFIEEALKKRLIISSLNIECVRDEIDIDYTRSYRFVDEKIRKIINDRLDENNRKKIHRAIGKISIEALGDPKQRKRESIFEIANHCNYSSELVLDLEEKLKIATVNLQAAKKAKALMQYDLARNYTIEGIGIVPEEIWTARQDLAFNLHKERAEIEYLNGNWEGAKILVEYLISHATSSLEKAEFENILIPHYTLNCQYEEAISIGKRTLKSLGVEFARHDLSSELKAELDAIQLTLSNQKIDYLKTHPPLSDRKWEMVMKLLRSLEFPTACIDRTLWALIIAKMVRITLLHGYAPESAIAYVAYGILQTSIFNNASLGYDLAVLGIELSEKIGTLSQKCHACMRLGVNIAPWTQSLDLSIKIVEESIRVGLEVNEFQFAGYSFAYKSVLWFYSGKNLKDLLFESLKISDFCRKHKNQWAMDVIEAVRMPILNLCGKTVSALEFDTDHFREAEYLERCKTRKIDAALACYELHKAQVLYLYGEYELALRSIRNVEASIDSIWSTFSIAEYQFYYALILAALYNSASPSQQTEYLELLEPIQSLMLGWTDRCPANFQYRYLLISAEMAALKGNDLEAMDLYDRALECAREQDWVYGDALANERAALFWLNRGNHKIAKVYLQDAYYSYQEWEAVRKLEQLEQKYAYLLPAAISPTKLSSTQTHSVQTLGISANSTGSRSRVLDLATVTKAAQVLSGEIEIGHLLDKLMQMVIANAGATSGSLILAGEEGLTIEATKMVGSEEINVRQSTPVQESDRLPLSIVNYVARTHESVVANDATHDSAFANDPYIQNARPKSILCAPIQGQGKLIGLVYVENNLVTDAFTRERLDVLMLLCAQGAIALENARLYENLQTSQIKMIQGEKMATLGQLVAGVAHEINNPVGFIAANISHATGYFEDLISLIELYQEVYPEPNRRIEEEIDTIDLEFLLEDLPKILSSMEMGTERIRQISKSLRTFSRNDESAKVSVNLHDGIDSTLMILKHRLKANNERPAIEVIRDYGTLPEIECFAGQLNQVFMNLLANAIDALEESNQGRTYADLENHPNKIRISTEFKEERQVAIVTIADNGLGMTDNIKQKVFDNLFTTKPVGKGTGLGLSISRQIVVEKHGGRLSCESTVGEGTQFTIEVPST